MRIKVGENEAAKMIDPLFSIGRSIFFSKFFDKPSVHRKL